MISAKQAVEIAKQQAVEMLGQNSSNLEEIERESYKDRDAWSITLSLPKDMSQLSAFSQLKTDPIQYKRFLIDSETGDLLAMKLRELAFR